jgi:hypothetical protein
LTSRVWANKAVFLAPKAAFHSFQGKQLMGLPFGIADHKYRTGTLTVAQVDDEEKSPFRFGNTSVRQLEADIRAFIDLHNKNPKPFKWTKSADQILVSVKRFCHKAQQTLCAEL